MTTPNPHRPARLIAAAALLALASTTGAPAQEQATTLARMAERADAIVRARVLAVDPYDALRVRAHFRIQSVVGAPAPGAEAFTDVGTTFVVEEPAGRACGRAVYGMARGASYLAFLRVDPNGNLQPFATGSRAFVMVAPGLEQHVEALRSADASTRRELLVDALSSAIARIREDAAFALPALPGLEAADEGDRSRIAAAVQATVTEGQRTAPSLLLCAQRIGLARVAPSLRHAFLTASAPAALDRLLCRTIPTLDPAGTIEALGTDDIWDGQDAPPADRRLRVCALIRELPANDSTIAFLEASIPSAPTEVRAELGTIWLEKGMPADGLRVLLDDDKILAASRARLRLRATATTRFRSIRRPR